MAEGKLICEGKTKQIREVNPSIVEVYSKDDLTAGNGAKHDVLEGKGELATATTSNVFELLFRSGLPVAYLHRTGPRTFEARWCEMIPLEVVVRRVAEGSYLKRNVNAKKGDRLEPLVVEFYLKTTGKRWKPAEGVEYALSVDDPYLARFEEGCFAVCHPAKPVCEGELGLKVPFSDLGVAAGDLAHITALARRAFAVLERAWLYCGKGRLKDLKLEFGWYGVGRTPRPKLFIADVLDNDSWRLDIAGCEVSKEVYRQGGDLAHVLTCYRLVAECSERFRGLAA